MINIIIPLENEIPKNKIVFLAGPIQGAPDYHNEIISYFIKNAPDKNFTIASPKKDYKHNDFNHQKQVDWETKFLNAASKNGIIIFWLAKEVENVKGRAYAQTSRFEISEWLVKSSLDKNIEIFIGIEEGFSGDVYIKHRATKDLNYKKPIYNDLNKMLDDIIKII